MPQQTVAIVVVVIVNGLFTHRAGARGQARQPSSLHELLPRRVTVVRDGSPATDVDVDALVLGDLVVLGAG